MTDRGETLGERVRRLRRERNLTIDRFAAMAGVATSQVSKVENNETKHLQPGTLEAYARVLRVPEQFIRLGTWPEPDTPAPPLEVYLRQNERLSEENVATVQRIVQALKREQLAELENTNGEPSGV